MPSPVALKMPDRSLSSASTSQSEVADVDELDVSLRRRRGEHLAAARETVGPGGEPSRRIVGADDETGADDQRPVSEHVLDGAFAEGLQRAVVLVRVAHLLDRLVRERPDRARLVHGAAEVGVDGDAGDEGVAAGAWLEERRRRADNARDVATRVDHGIPLTPREHLEAAVAVAVQLLDLRIELRARPAAVEEGELVTAAESGVGDRPAEEPRAAE